MRPWATKALSGLKLHNKGTHPFQRESTQSFMHLGCAAPKRTGAGPPTTGREIPWLGNLQPTKSGRGNTGGTRGFAAHKSTPTRLRQTKGPGRVRDLLHGWEREPHSAKRPSKTGHSAHNEATNTSTNAASNPNACTLRHRLTSCTQQLNTRPPKYLVVSGWSCLPGASACLWGGTCP
jgi:hypothetical protein